VGALRTEGSRAEGIMQSWGEWWKWRDDGCLRLNRSGLESEEGSCEALLYELSESE
jgi:hypothetical protein